MAFKMKKFSGFGNSPMKQEKVDTKTKTRKNILTGNRTVIETQEVEGVKKDISHMHSGIHKLGGKIDKIYWVLLAAVGTVAILLLERFIT